MVLLYTFFILGIPTRIIIHHRIIPTVCIQIQPISPIAILLHKPPKNRIIKSCPQVILPCQFIILLTCVTDAVVGLFCRLRLHPKCVILIAVADFCRPEISAVLSCSSLW